MEVVSETDELQTLSDCLGRWNAWVTEKRIKLQGIELRRKWKEVKEK